MSKFVQISNEQAQKSYADEPTSNYITEPGEYILTITTAGQKKDKNDLPYISATCEGSAGTDYQGKIFNWALFPRLGDTSDAGLKDMQQLFRQIAYLHPQASKKIEEDKANGVERNFGYYDDLIDRILTGDDTSTVSFIEQVCKFIAGATITIRLYKKNNGYLGVGEPGARLYIGELPVKNNDGWGKPELDVSKPF